MGRWFCSLRFRLTSAIILATLPGIVSLVWSLDLAASRRLYAAAHDSLESQASSLAAKVGQWDREVSVVTQQLASIPAMARMQPSEQTAILREAMRGIPQISRLLTIAPDGTTVARSDDGPPVELGDRQWVLAVMSGSPMVRQALVSRLSSHALMVYAAPLRQPDGKIVGAVAASAELLDLSALTANGDVQQSGYRFVVDDQGRALAYPDTAMVVRLKSLADFPPVRDLLAGHSVTPLRFTDAGGTAWLAAVARMPNGWSAVSVQQEAAVLAPVRNFRNYEFALVGGVGLVVAGLVWLISGSLVRPVSELSELAGDVAAGKLHRRAREGRGDEIGQLAKSFNRMVERLQVGFRTIEARVERRTQTLRLRNAELQRARQIAEQAAQHKDEFLANTSHEIRTPLTAILGYAELLVDIKMTEDERAKALQSIQYNSQHLLNVINDVLDVAKLDANKMEVECVEFPPAMLINDVVTLMRAKADQKGLKLETAFASQIPELVQTDPTRLRQILMNLLGNAVKYTDEGSITLTVKMIVAQDGGESFLQFDVIDTGIGIAEDQLPRLFRPFAQASAATARQNGGSGLGLVISQRLARLLGGDITVRSVFGEGSTFTATVRIGRIQGARLMNPQYLMHDSVAALPFVEDEHAAALEGMRVLLADDTPANQDVISRVLRAAGAEVVAVGSGRRACHEAMDAFQSARPYHVVLMDVRMPELDGLSATTKLRGLGYPGAIIALTASIGDDDRGRCITVGCDDVARKPIERGKLIALLSRWAPSVSGAAGGAGQHSQVGAGATDIAAA